MCEKFMDWDCDEFLFKSVVKLIELVVGVKELIIILVKNDIEVYIVLGFIDYIIRSVLGDELF